MTYNEFVSTYGCEDDFFESFFNAIEDSDVNPSLYDFDYDGVKITVSSETEEENDNMYYALCDSKDEGQVFRVTTYSDTVINVENVLKTRRHY